MQALTVITGAKHMQPRIPYFDIRDMLRRKKEVRQAQACMHDKTCGAVWTWPCHMLVLVSF